jgi:SPP1 gp7 family putative phage head morphogenesis protein
MSIASRLSAALRALTSGDGDRALELPAVPSTALVPISEAVERMSDVAAATAPATEQKSMSWLFDNPDAQISGGLTSKLTRPYAQSVWVQRAIKHVAQPIGAVPLRWYPDNSNGTAPVEDPLLEAWWKQPARGLRPAEFILASVGWRKLAGECFWLLGDDALLPFPEVRGSKPLSPMILARPDRMRHVVENGQIVAWEFRAPNGRTYDLVPEQVIHMAMWNPYDDFRGLAEWESAAVPAESEYMASVFGRNLMQNSGDRGQYVIAKNGVLEGPQREQIIAALRAKRAAAARGEFRPVFLTGEIEVEDPAIQALDANVAAMQLADRHAIFIAFGVPASMADVQPSYSVGSASDRYRLIEETCQPEAEALADGLQLALKRLTGRELVAQFDFDEHPTMQAVRRERVQAAQQLWTMGMPLKEVSDYLDLGLPRTFGDDKGYLSFGLVPVGESALPDDNPLLGEGEDEEDAAADLKALLAHRRAQKSLGLSDQSKIENPKSKIGTACAHDGEPTTEAKLWQKARDPREVAAWRAHIAGRATSVRRYVSGFTRELIAVRADVLRKISKADITEADLPAVGSAEEGRNLPTGLRTKAVAADLNFDGEKFRGSLTSRLRRAAEAALKDSVAQLYKEIGSDDPTTMPAAEVLAFLRQRDNQLRDVADEVHTEIQRALEEGLIAGEGRDKLSARIRGVFNEISRERADRIAQTETAAAYGTGRQSAMESAGVEFKQWLTSGNDNVRPAHREANGQTVRTDEAFTVDGEELMHPGDPSGSPGNIINCHCVSIAVAPPEDAR